MFMVLFSHRDKQAKKHDVPAKRGRVAGTGGNPTSRQQKKQKKASKTRRSLPLSLTLPTVNLTIFPSIPCLVLILTHNYAFPFTTKQIHTTNSERNIMPRLPSINPTA